MEKLVLCDIDGTILDNMKRKQQCIMEATGKSIGLEKLSQNYEINRFLTMGEFGAFSRIFFSGKYLPLDTPVPGAARALQGIVRKGYHLVYLTARHQAEPDSMRKPTLDWLERNGFPRPLEEGVEIMMKSRPGQRDDEFKMEAIPKIRGMGFPIAGIGDLASDALTYSRLGAVPLVFRRPYNKGQAMPPGTVMVDSWEGVLDWLERNG